MCRYVTHDKQSKEEHITHKPRKARESTNSTLPIRSFSFNPLCRHTGIVNKSNKHRKIAPKEREFNFQMHRAQWYQTGGSAATLIAHYISFLHI